MPQWAKTEPAAQLKNEHTLISVSPSLGLLHPAKHTKVCLNRIHQDAFQGDKEIYKGKKNQNLGYACPVKLLAYEM